MANILLTEKCVRSCPYCFAKKYMEGSEESDFLTWDNLIYLVDFFITSGERHLSLLGGEPGIHPDFDSFLIYLTQREIDVTVFTSGIISAPKIDNIKKHLPQNNKAKLKFVCNLNSPTLSHPKERESLDYFLSELGSHVTPGVNIYKDDFDWDYLFSYFEKYGLDSHLRVGLAHPILGAKNSCLSPLEIPQIAERITHYYSRFNEKKISIGFDCGMPLCIFSDEQIGQLYKISKGRLKFSCGPAVDIGPDMNVWACFPLADVSKKSVFEFNSVQEIRDYFQKLLSGNRKEIKGLFDECQDCSHYGTLCGGGCLTHIMAKTQNLSKKTIAEA